jgi:hypothetical protein
MQLWNEYEGRIIDGRFPLKRLLEPEGRSAFFSTTNDSGAPAVLRLIEAHFDEPEILARWNVVSRIDQANLIKLNRFGQTTLDETALVYAVMEPADANLADILKERVLSTQETLQVATSLVPALEALHANNLIHEHLEPANVLAVGEIVKLRSDCIREAPEGTEANEAKARDVRDLVTVLLQSLTRQRRLSPETNLPAPFREIVTNGMSGAWGLREIAAALSPASSTGPQAVAEISRLSTVKSKTNTPPDASIPERPASTDRGPAPSSERITVPVEDEKRRVIPWTTIAAALILALFIGWHFLHKSPAPIPTLANMPEQSPSSVAAASGPTAAPSTAGTATVTNERASAHPDARTQWRVVAYTYNHEDQAKEKAALIASQHAFLNPEVFSPKGHAPYLVTVGGAMSRNEALAFRKRARAAGLPRDTYAQNFPANAR